MKKKLLAILLITMTVFTACSSKKNETITMGTNAKFPPFEYITEQGLVGKFDGIDVAIAMEIAKEAGKDLEILDMEFTSVLAAVPTGKVDFAAAGMSYTPERGESMDFSIPYLVATQYIVVKDDNTEIASIDDIINKNVGAVEGYTGEEVCRELNIPNLVSYKTSVDAIMGLNQGKVDVVVIDSFTAKAMISKNEGLKYVEDPNFENEEYAIAVKKGNQEMLDIINTVLERLISSGEIEKLALRYGEVTGFEN